MYVKFDFLLCQYRRMMTGTGSHKFHSLIMEKTRNRLKQCVINNIEWFLNGLQRIECRRTSVFSGFKWKGVTVNFLKHILLPIKWIIWWMKIINRYIILLKASETNFTTTLIKSIHWLHLARLDLYSCLLEGAQSRYFKLFWPSTKLPLNWRKPENNTLQR